MGHGHWGGLWLCMEGMSLATLCMCVCKWACVYECVSVYVLYVCVAAPKSVLTLSPPGCTQANEARSVHGRRLAWAPCSYATITEREVFRLLFRSSSISLGPIPTPCTHSPFSSPHLITTPLSSWTSSLSYPWALAPLDLSLWLLSLSLLLYPD